MVEEGEEHAKPARKPVSKSVREFIYGALDLRYLRSELSAAFEKQGVTVNLPT